MRPARSFASLRLALAALAALAGAPACAAPTTPAEAPVARAPRATASAPATLVAPSPTSPPPPATSASSRVETLDARAARVHREALVVDTHDDIPTVMLGSRVDHRARLPFAHTDIPRLQEGGVTAVFFSVYVEADLAEHPTPRGGGALRRAVDLVDLTYATVERHPSELLLATTAEDIRRAKREGKTAVLMGVEGGHAIESSLAALRVLHRLGCRYLTLTHTNTNTWADSAGGGSPAKVVHHGLSRFGEEVVREMQRLGMLVDVSHVSDETFWKTLSVARAPVIASHSSARALAASPRNLTDDMLRAMAQNGGVVMVNFWSNFLSDDYREAARRFTKEHETEIGALRAAHKGDPIAMRRAWDRLRATYPPLPTVPLARLVDHIEHVAKVAGVDHVGLGSDFDGVDALPEGIDGVDAMPKITRELLARGHTEEDVKKILGGNFLRVFEAAERFASATQTSLSGDGSPRRIDDP
jgi:membrane dipeptidase